MIWKTVSKQEPKADDFLKQLGWSNKSWIGKKKIEESRALHHFRLAINAARKARSQRQIVQERVCGTFLDGWTAYLMPCFLSS